MMLAPTERMDLSTGSIRMISEPGAYFLWTRSTAAQHAQILADCAASERVGIQHGHKARLQAASARLYMDALGWVPNERTPEVEVSHG